VTGGYVNRYEENDLTSSLRAGETNKLTLEVSIGPMAHHQG